MTAPRRVLLMPAGSPTIGGGHVMRALALTQALRARGAACTLDLNPYGEALAARFGGGGFDVHSRFSDGPQALAAAANAVAPDVMMLDDYAADARTVEALGRPRPRVVVIDDLADRPHACDLLVDPGYGRKAADYLGLVPQDCRLLTGPAFALLRPGFERSDRTATPSPSVNRVFVSLGLSDVDAATGRVVDRLRAASPHACLDIAVAADAPSLPALRARADKDAAIALHVDAREVAALMSNADVAVGAGGASTWERCALGLPSLAVIVADNQRRVVRALEADSLLLACDLHAPDFETAFDDAWGRLQSPALRGRLATSSLALCDGRGADRVAEAILAL